MSVNEYKHIILDGIEYKLVPVNEKKHYTTEELSIETKFATETIYKAKKKMTKDVHYFKPNGGKILFTQEAVDFLIKGEHRESKQRVSISGQKEPVSVDKLISQWEEA